MIFTAREPVHMAPLEGGETSGGAGESAAPVAAQVAAPVAPAAAPQESAPVTGQPAAPKTMLEAVGRSLANRDEQGRFAKTPEQLASEATAAQVAPAAKPAEAAPDEDITKMPDGLGGKAQQRFQALANGIKERDTQIATAKDQLAYVSQAFQTHGVKQDQFEQATAVIGMMNRGDLNGALAVLDEQRRQIAIMLGKPLPGVDVLSDHPDLRQQVDALQLPEDTAIEVARLRRQQASVQQVVQTHQQNQANQRDEHQAITAGRAMVDQWVKQVAASDLDFPRIEKLLLPRLAELTEGVAPQHWAKVVRANYEMIKESGAAFRQPGQVLPDPLRPMGGGGGTTPPANMLEAVRRSLGR